MMECLSGGQTERRTVMIDATYPKVHRTASSLRVKRGPRATDRTHEGRHEHQAACRERCERRTDQPVHDGGAGQRLHRRRRGHIFGVDLACREMVVDRRHDEIIPAFEDIVQGLFGDADLALTSRMETGNIRPR